MARPRRTASGRATCALGAIALGLVLSTGALGGSARSTAVQATVVVTDRTITVSHASVLEGVVTFVAYNRGRKVHALAIKGPSLSLRTPKLKAGKSARLKVMLHRGRYTLWDPVTLGTARKWALQVTAPPVKKTPGLVPPPGEDLHDPDATWPCDEDVDDIIC